MVDTIRKGYPFGSLLLYEIHEDNYKYQLIDGLQRLTTIMNFEKNKYEYINLEEIATNEFEKIILNYEEKACALISDQTKQKMIEIISGVFKRNTTGHSLTTAILKALQENMSFFQVMN